MNGSGQCLCGAVTFAEGVESHVHACHCSMCRRERGPGMAVAVKSVVFTGEANIERYRSSQWAERGFCKTCGSNLFYLLMPARYIWKLVCSMSRILSWRAKSLCGKPAWYEFAGGHPKHNGLPVTRLT